ncbi:hypothetical protein QX25_18380 (plasmid) [Stutzerimonas stutzeri]|nr:hypothetical protein QX25_18380 [Stutzerimonas stutzeri]
MRLIGRMAFAELNIPAADRAILEVGIGLCRSGDVLHRNSLSDVARHFDSAHGEVPFLIGK